MQGKVLYTVFHFIISGAGPVTYIRSLLVLWSLSTYSMQFLMAAWDVVRLLIVLLIAICHSLPFWYPWYFLTCFLIYRFLLIIKLILSYLPTFHTKSAAKVQKIWSIKTTKKQKKTDFQCFRVFSTNFFIFRISEIAKFFWRGQTHFLFFHRRKKICSPAENQNVAPLR